VSTEFLDTPPKPFIIIFMNTKKTPKNPSKKPPPKPEFMNLATRLTLLRIGLIVPFVVSFYTGDIQTAFFIFVGASLTDYLDGWVARKYNQATPLGAFLDSMADKLLVAAMLILLMEEKVITSYFVVAVLVILLRELYISGLREYVGRTKTSVSWYGKWKTVAQMVSSIFLLGFYAFSLPVFVFQAGLGLLTVSAFLSILSGWDYTLKAFQK